MHAVALAAAIDEAVCVVCARELLAFGYRYLEEIAQWLPALAHLVLEQVLRGYERADLGVVFVEATLAVLLKVAFPEFGPELCWKDPLAMFPNCESDTESNLLSSIGWYMPAAQSNFPTALSSGSVARQCTVFMVLACQLSMSRVVTKTLASGYASINSFAKATAGQSHTAWQWPRSWSHCSRPNVPLPSYLEANASDHIKQSGGFSTDADIMW